jgi:hypothetical protein
MGKFGCRCGNVISDSVYPCEFVGELRWQTETESDSQARARVIESFLSVVESGNSVSWIQDYFGGDYPLDLSNSEVIEDIIAKVSNSTGRSVYRCPECERIYVQKEFYSDEWACYEKAE